MSASKPPIILASTSPRRRELLEMLGVPFEILAPKVDEAAYDHLMSDPKDYVETLARLKAESIAQQHAQAIVIGSDTTVHLMEKTLNKPQSVQEAQAMLHTLQGKVHTVYSAVAVSYQGHTEVSSLTTQVRFCPMSAVEIQDYVSTEEPMDKAGAYAIQGVGGMFIDGIDGCFFNVMGMSPALVRELFAAHGLHLLDYSVKTAGKTS